MNMLIKLTPGGADKELKLNYLMYVLIPVAHQTLVDGCSIIIRPNALYTGFSSKITYN